MIQYPMDFKVTSNSKNGTQTQWSSQANGGSVTVAIPPEFEGPGKGLSPEDLYAMALVNCFIATFKVIAEKSSVTFAELKAEGVLTVDRNESGAPWMKKLKLHVSLQGCSDRERGERLLQKTSTLCMILNSVKTEKEFSFEVI